eukprot:jgi/Botrbrau1/7856/Bobra.9_2s0032.1
MVVDKPHILLLCIALSLAPTCLGRSPAPASSESLAQATPLIAAIQNIQPIPVQPSAVQGAPEETGTQNPPSNPTAISQDASIPSDPLIMIPRSVPEEALNPQIQVPEGTESPPPGSVLSDAAVAAPLLRQASVGTIRPVPGAKAVLPKAPYVNFTALELFPDSTVIEPSPIEQLDPAAPSNASDTIDNVYAKPAVCSNNPGLTLSASGTIVTSTCRAYLYLNAARSSYTMCTAWFVSPTHAALAGHCIADGGTRRYFPVASNGRYGTVCCRTQSNTGPDNCQSGYGFDIVNFVTNIGWYNFGYASNDGAVLKLRRPSNVASGVGVARTFGPPSPFCPSAAVSYAGYPARSTSLSGCNQAWAERLAVATTSGVASCTTSSGAPSLAFRGSTCGGMSGGPLWNAATNRVIGIVIQSDIYCNSGRSLTLFSAITSSGTSWGVNVASLIAAVP